MHSQERISISYNSYKNSEFDVKKNCFKKTKKLAVCSMTGEPGGWVTKIL